MPNRLSQESSPYLLQHSRNPVDWYPWGDEAFERARSEDKPVLLSIGYSACHWCHVMAHESFENESIAAIMNENFINIKVDREERPDLDHIYMEAVQAMTGSGGWPMTVFLTPEAEPFYGGTYFPPEDRQGLPGFPKVLKAVVNAYRTSREAILGNISQIKNALLHAGQAPDDVQSLNSEILKQAYASLTQSFDRNSGGFGGAPKFPQPLAMEFLLRYYYREKAPLALEMVNTTLDKMSRGGIYDHIGGGFHRYSTDYKWLVPHFEKMLYDNALLSRLYLHAFLSTGQSRWAVVTSETLDYLLQEMRSPEGGFYSTQDADSEGEEGKYYLWSPVEMEAVLGTPLALKVEDYYGVTPEGNFEGRSILFRPTEIDPPDEIQDAKRLLLATREKRVKPGRDEKSLASWNGLMLTSLAESACALQRPDYLEAALANGSFLLNKMMVGGRLKHSYKDGQSRIDGFLEDYAMVVQGLLALHQATLDIKWLHSAIDLTEKMVELFYDEESGLMYDTESGQSDLIIRPRNNYDGAVPAATSVAASVLLEMAVLTGNVRFRRIAEQGLKSVSENAGRVPLGFSQWLCALDFYLVSPQEIVIAGPGNHPRSQEFLKTICSQWMPDKVLAAFDPAVPDAVKGLPLFEGRLLVNGQPTVYICRNNTCLPPISDVGELERNLKSSISNQD